MTTKFSSREFNQDTGRAKKAAEDGPVYITDRGRPSHVLLTFEDYRRLAGVEQDIVEILGNPAGVEDVAFEPPPIQDNAAPAKLD